MSNFFNGKTEQIENSALNQMSKTADLAFSFFVFYLQMNLQQSSANKLTLHLEPQVTNRLRSFNFR